jgi:hypothetical protein
MSQSTYPGPRLAAIMIASGFVPVFEGERFLELADPARVAFLSRASNVKVIRKRNKGERSIVELQMCAKPDDDLALNAKTGNPRRLSHDHAVDASNWTGNPNRVWTIKPIRKRDRAIFRAVLDSCAA